jgi:hypothetical protein
MMAADIGGISGNTIEFNNMAGIGVTQGSTVGLMDNNIIDSNGTAGATGLAVKEGSSAVIQGTTVSNSGTTNMSFFDAGTMVTIRDCTLFNSTTPNIEVGTGANVTVENSTIDTTNGSPNLRIDDPGTVFTMIGGTVTNSTQPGLVVDNDPTIIIRDTVFDRNGTAGTAHLNILNCYSLELDNVTVSNSYHWSFIQNCDSGSIMNSEFHDIGQVNQEKRGGFLSVSNSTLDIIGNVFHDPGWYESHIQVLNSTLNVYHNTIKQLQDDKGWRPLRRQCD